MRTFRSALLPSLVASAALLLAVGPAPLSGQSLAVEVRAGLDGPGAGLVARLGSSVNARIGVRYFSATLDGVEDLQGEEAEWTADGRLLFVSGIADWYPFGNAFHLSGGAVYNGLSGDGRIRAVNSMTVQSRTYSPEELGSLSADVGFGSSIAPYAGLGFGNPLGRRIGVQLDLGVMYLGSPTVELSGTGMIAPTASQASIIEDNVRDIRFYPVASLGLSARLF